MFENADLAVFDIHRRLQLSTVKAKVDYYIGLRKFQLRWKAAGGKESDQFALYNITNYSVSQKKGATLYMAITLSILDRFAKFFHCCKEQ